MRFEFLGWAFIGICVEIFGFINLFGCVHVALVHSSPPFTSPPCPPPFLLLCDRSSLPSSICLSLYRSLPLSHPSSSLSFQRLFPDCSCILAPPACYWQHFEHANDKHNFGQGGVWRHAASVTCKDTKPHYNYNKKYLCFSMGAILFAFCFFTCCQCSLSERQKSTKGFASVHKGAIKECYLAQLSSFNAEIFGTRVLIMLFTNSTSEFALPELVRGVDYYC